MMRNHEGYFDPTAGIALRGIEEKERAERLGRMPLIRRCWSFGISASRLGSRSPWQWSTASSTPIGCTTKPSAPLLSPNMRGNVIV